MLGCTKRGELGKESGTGVDELQSGPAVGILPIVYPMDDGQSMLPELLLFGTLRWDFAGFGSDLSRTVDAQSLQVLCSPTETDVSASDRDGIG